MNGKLVLNDLLGLSKADLDITKVRLNMNNGVDDPIDIFKKDPNKLLEWNYWNNKPYKVGQISIGLVHMQDDDYLLFTVGKIKKIKSITGGGVGVDYDTYKQYDDLYGRVVVSYHNTTQNLFRNANSIMSDLVVKEILPTFYTGFDFPGYEKVHLTFSELETIVNGNYPSYKNALAMQKAVYVQTDKATGKLYIGSATSANGMLLARWRAYVKNGHGGNVDLINLVNTRGFNYIKTNFTYAILENYNQGTPDKYVLERESYWKKVLDTRNHGYNKN